MNHIIAAETSAGTLHPSPQPMIPPELTRELVLPVLYTRAGAFFSYFISATKLPGHRRIQVDGSSYIFYSLALYGSQLYALVFTMWARLSRLPQDDLQSRRKGDILGAYKDYSDTGLFLDEARERGKHNNHSLALACGCDDSTITRHFQGRSNGSWDVILPQIIRGNKNVPHDPVFEYQSHLYQPLEKCLKPAVNSKKWGQIMFAVQEAFDELDTPEHASATITGNPLEQASIQQLYALINQLRTQVRQLDARVKRLEQEL